MEYKCCLRNVQDLIRLERRFGEAFSGVMILFWIDGGIPSEFCERPVKTPPVWQKVHQASSCVCLVCGRIWKGDLLVADVGELENLDTSEIHARRLIAKEVHSARKSMQS